MIRTLLTSQITQPYWNHSPNPTPSLWMDTFVFLFEVLPLKLWPATWYVGTLWWVDFHICLFGDWAKISRWRRPLSHTRSPNPAPHPQEIRQPEVDSLVGFEAGDSNLRWGCVLPDTIRSMCLLWVCFLTLSSITSISVICVIHQAMIMDERKHDYGPSEFEAMEDHQSTYHNNDGIWNLFQREIPLENTFQNMCI